MCAYAYRSMIAVLLDILTPFINRFGVEHCHNNSVNDSKVRLIVGLSFSAFKILSFACGCMVINWHYDTCSWDRYRPPHSRCFAQAKAAEAGRRSCGCQRAYHVLCATRAEYDAVNV
jgi:hypothetical protein